jgi:ABC-type phosphate transport system substrate-binding protein
LKVAWTTILVAVLGTALFAQTPAERRAPGWEGVAIVVDRHNPVNNISVTQLREMLFGDRLWWAHNRRITLVTLPRGSAERETVLRSMYKMDERSFEKFFFFGVYRGELANGPTTLASASEVKKFVSLKPGSLAYLRASDVDSSVKVLRIDGLLPDDDGYPLRLRTRKFK